VWVGELYLELHRATLTSQHQTKQGNRRSEHLLVEAELWAATAAARTDHPYPYDELDALWQQVLLQQFHDILPGTSIAWVHREAVERYAAIADRLEALITSALSALAGAGDRTIVVNPAPSLQGGALAQSAILTDDVEATTPVVLTEVDGGFVLTNDLVRIVVDARGLVTSAVDLSTGRDAIAPDQVANLLQLHQDFPNMWDAWDVDRYYRNRVEDLVSVTSIDSSVDDAGVARVVVSRAFGDSTVTQEIVLEPGSQTLEFDQTTDWHETEKFLKVAFPLDVRAEHTIAETQFGAQKRATHTNTSWEAAKFETSMHRYVLVEEPGFGVALVNDSIHGFDVTRDAVDGHVTTTLRLSLLRAPRFPDPETDQGVQTHRYGLVVGTDVVGATTAGILMNTGARTVTGGTGFGPLVQASGDVVVSSVKLADDRSGDLVVRVYEPSGRRGTGGLAVDGPFGEPVEVTLLEERDPALPGVDAVTDGVAAFAVDAFEVRTFRFPRI
jgi:alpha-mannosidase